MGYVRSIVFCYVGQALRRSADASDDLRMISLSSQLMQHPEEVAEETVEWRVSGVIAEDDATGCANCSPKTGNSVDKSAAAACVCSSCWRSNSLSACSSATSIVAVEATGSSTNRDGIRTLLVERRTPLVEGGPPFLPWTTFGIAERGKKGHSNCIRDWHAISQPGEI